MRYEPLKYIFEYEIGAFAIFLVIMVRFLSTRRFPNQNNRMYLLILWATVVNIVLDIASSYIIENIFAIPLVITYIVNTLFYMISVLMLLFMMLYTLALIRYIDNKLLRRIFPMLLPGIAISVLLLTNPLTKLFFYVDDAKGYIHGKLFILIYVTCFIYFVFTLIITLKNRSTLNHSEFNTIIVFLMVVLASTVVQYLIPNLLVTGIAIMFAVEIMYFTIQNAEAMTDITTGCFTYEAMLTFLHSYKQEQTPVQIVAIKIHNMSRINELLGIENGSLLLRKVSESMRESSKNVWVFRMRGSCFVAITSNKKDHSVLKKRTYENTDKVWKVGNTEVLLQATVCSIASDELFKQPISAETVIKLLETAFTQKFDSGDRVRYITVDEELINRNNRREAVEYALREALSTGEGLDIYFQPLWSVSRKRFTSAEVLLRLKHKTLGDILPNEFIAIAESCGIVTELDEWVVRRSCEMIARNHLKETGIERLEINLSALEFMHSRLPELLNDIINHYAVDPSFLCFEITETATTESFDLLRDCMQKICSYGCSFALDDYGTGYANISKVLGLPFSIIKLDKSLLYHSVEVIEDLSSMFSRMNLSVVVEGVETAKQADFCSNCKIDYIQGFYYARPMAQQEFISFMKK